MPSKAADGFAGFQVPHADGFVIASGERTAAIGSVGHGGYALRVSLHAEPRHTVRQITMPHHGPLADEEVVTIRRRRQWDNHLAKWRRSGGVKEVGLHFLAQ